MKQYRVLDINGAITDNKSLQKHLEKIASNHILQPKSEKSTYPIPRMIENYTAIKEVYELLNNHLKLGIAIHPAGEWLLDNFYIIEETVKNIQKELPKKKYINFVGIQNGKYHGFSRIYVIASEIVAYTDNKIDGASLENYLKAYQKNKTLSMDEIWNIGIFINIVLIEKIRTVCEYIYISQMQKYKVESIVERLVEKRKKDSQIFNKRFYIKNKKDFTKFPFVEYMSYRLKQYGRKTVKYLEILEKTVEKTGTSISDIIKKEHFNIAIKKVSIGNAITSIKEIGLINFLDIFEKTNEIEEVLKKDPAKVYSKMDYKTKELYRNKIKEISKKTKLSENYVSKRALELAQKNDNQGKYRHIGYYLIDDGIKKLNEKLSYNLKELNNKTKAKLYVFFVAFLSFFLTILQALWCFYYIKNRMIFITSLIIFYIPISEVALQLTQYILGKIVKPQIIPKLDFYDGIDLENSSMIVIPTIIDSKEKVKELARKLEVYYLANKSKNLYFVLLGDCKQSKKKIEKYDYEVIDQGLKCIQELNEKYKSDDFPIFHFLYRNRIWNEKENCYMGWERKRGLLTTFNEYLLGNCENDFKANTIEKNKFKLPKIKYIITLDSDTDLTLNSAFELIGAMAHILNKPELNKNKNLIIEGHALIQPRVGVSLDVSYKNLFTKIFAGSGGIEPYTNAISDVYQDNFDEGIFTGKGIYDLEIFSKVLKNEIPENTVLSHDLLEGSYLRCGLATDILLIDGYPSNYMSFMNRLSRWTRGDWQIAGWIFKGPLNFLSRYKILDNLRRSVFEVSCIIEIIFFILLSLILKIKTKWFILFLLLIIDFPFILEIIDKIILKKDGEKKQKTYTPKIDGIIGALIRGIITIGCLPYKAMVSEFAKWKTIYRMKISNKHLLEWTTSEEAEKLSKTDLISYYKMMIINVIFGSLFVAIGMILFETLYIVLGIIWIITPALMYFISVEKKEKEPIDFINTKEKEFIMEVANRTWEYFKTYLNKDTNFLIPDNYQEDRNPIVVDRTSSTNIGLSILAVISSLDLGFITKKDAFFLLENIINTVDNLPKWNGHLYNWYNIKTKEPLQPRYISTVDSGNFIGYLYVLKSFLEEESKENNNIEILNKLKQLLKRVKNIINDTDFSKLYNKDRRLFSIGFNIEENKLTDSYYDLLASEARQASLVAIALRDVPIKHWNNLSRTMTNMNNYKGLVSWAGTAFEYLMPNINIPKYKGSLLDESCKFAIESQIEYCKRLGIPWGITEAAFNAKDLYSNYQYKAFGIPWLGLKRGLADEIVIASYGSILAITEKPKEVIKNLRILEEQGMYNKFGFYESIDYTPSRMLKQNYGSPVKTYMAHHQGLILLSINNLINNKILSKRFIKNPEIEAVSILLQERMPEKYIITKENKEKVEKPIYKDYENYYNLRLDKVDERLIRGNIISNANYTVAINQKGEGFSKFKNYYINRYKKTDDYPQGIGFFIKNVQSNKTWSTFYKEKITKPDKYLVNFMPDQNYFERIDGNIKTKMKITTAPNEAVEIRRLELENLGNTEELLEITSYFEPILSSKEKDYAHPAFNNMFLGFEYDDENECFIVKRRKRNEDEKELFLVTKLSSDCETIGDIEYEFDKEKFIREK